MTQYKTYLLSFCIMLLLASCSSLPAFKQIDFYKPLVTTDLETELESYISHFNSLSNEDRSIPKKELQFILPDDSVIELIWVPATTSNDWKRISDGRSYYLMGNGAGDFSLHRFVQLNYGFYISKTEVTQQQWRSVTGNNPSAPLVDIDNADQYPVNSIPFFEANRFIHELSSVVELSFSDKVKQQFLFDDYVIRFPSEAEWEYAARAGIYTIEDEQLDKTAVNINTIQPVMAKQANPWGIYDMVGNVREFTTDCWPTNDDFRFEDARALRINPLGPDYQINTRGGVNTVTAQRPILGDRFDCSTLYYRQNSLGLRLVLAPPIDQLNQAADLKPIPDSQLLSDEVRDLQMVSEKYGIDKFRVTHLRVLKEYNDELSLEMCYENNSTDNIYLSTVTFNDAVNTGKWGYAGGAANPGVGCSEIRLLKNSLYPYSSDQIVLESSRLQVEVSFAFEKYWYSENDRTQ